MKKFLVIVLTSVFLFTGCSSKNNFHEGNGSSWIQEQVQKGNLTQEQAEELLKQEKCLEIFL